VAMQKVRTVAQERVGKTCIKLVGFVLVWNLLGGGIYLFTWLEPFSYPSSIAWFIKYVHATLYMEYENILIIVLSQSGSLVTAGLFFFLSVSYTDKSPSKYTYVHAMEYKIFNNCVKSC
jgi:hypothetical protein